MKPRSVVYANRFASTYAEPNERVEVFGLAQWRDCPGRKERVGKAGALILTSARVVHWSDGEEAPDLLLPLDSVDLEFGSRVFPRMRVLNVVVRDPAGVSGMSFVIGKQLARRLLSVRTGPGGSAAETRLPTLAARGVWMPVVNHASGGPGTFTIEAGRPLFVTDGGTVHDYGWDSYASWSAAPSGQIFVNMSPAVGARMRFEPADVDAWRTVFSENGLQELARG